MRKINRKRSGECVSGPIRDAEVLLDLYENRERIYNGLLWMSEHPKPLPVYKVIPGLLEDMRRDGLDGAEIKGGAAERDRAALERTADGIIDLVLEHTYIDNRAARMADIPCGVKQRKWLIEKIVKEIDTIINKGEELSVIIQKIGDK